MSEETRSEPAEPPYSPPPAPSAEIEIRIARPDELTLIGELTAVIYVAAGYISPDDSYITRLRDAVSRAREAELLA